MRVFLQSLLLRLFLIPFIGWHGYHALPKRLGRVFLTLIGAECFIFFVGLLFHNELPDNVMIGILHICNTWYFALIYLTIFVSIIDCLYLLHRRYPWLPKWIVRHREGTKRALFVGLAVVVAGLLCYGRQQVKQPVIRHVPITIHKPCAGRDSLRIVMMSDLHIGEMISNQEVRKMVDMCNQAHPDLIVLVGDIIDYESRFAEQTHIEYELRRLRAPLGVYITMGNHEYRANRMAKLRWFDKTGLTLLMDSVVSPEQSFYLIGRDDYVNRRGRKSLFDLTTDLDTTRPIIILDHQPSSFNEVVMNRADLALHGHTHNGQLWPYALVLRLVYECPYGYYAKGPSQFYISSGVGCAGPPFRIGTHSEIVVLDIQFENE